MSAATGRAPEQVAAMSISGLDDHAQPYFAEKHDFKYCKRCVDAQNVELLHTKVLPYPLLPLTLRHWRAAWAMKCKHCGEALKNVHELIWPNAPQTHVPKKHLTSARQGALLLENAVQTHDRRVLRRYHKALVLAHWAFGLPNHRTALTSSSNKERVSALCAIARSEKQPLKKVAWLVATSNPERCKSIAAFLDQSKRTHLIVNQISDLMADQARTFKKVRERDAPKPTPVLMIETQSPPQTNCECYQAAQIAIAQSSQSKGKVSTRRLLRVADKALMELREKGWTPDTAITKSQKSHE